ncbi:MAG: aldo/keto reductase [Bacteroidetes bacterium]|nr:aldo/keto reductase [Bacteroidota bacterium]
MKDFVRLGAAGARVSRLCLGTMNFGKILNEADSHAILDRSADLGINFIDTADVYGGVKQRGRAEEYIGSWWGSGSSRRDSVVLATKVYGPMGTGPNDRGLSALHIRQACEASLRRLRTDHIDLYQMHHVDRTVSWEEIWEAMGRLVQEGKVVYVGSSNFAALHIARCQAVSLYNFAHREVELEVLPACREFGMAVLAWSPLAGGILGGTAGNGDSLRRREKDSVALLQRHGERIKAYESLCREIGHDAAIVALAWLLSRGDTVIPILGPRTVAQFEQSLDALEVRLSDDVLRRLDEIWPGPGGEAPEAYAW